MIYVKIRKKFIQLENTEYSTILEPKRQGLARKNSKWNKDSVTSVEIIEER